MSNERTHGAMLRRLISGVLCLALMLGLLPAGLITPAGAHWADSYAQQLVDWGIMRGDISGNLNLGNAITRAEFVTMMNRAYGYTNRGGHPFTDVRSTDWYSDDIDIAYNIGYFKGTSATTASPRKTLTREEAAVLLARNMMMQETVGETLGFSDSRTLSEWSRGLVGAATESGILSGYSDGSFQPKRNITRGEVAAMLVRSLGTPIQTPGDHALGNVYGNVTVNTSGVKLRDGVIVGNLYLTGGIDLGEVLLENVTVLGEIIVSGGGESNSSDSSIIMRNVEADGMTVDSISSQFVTIRAEGNTNIPTVSVRTNAYVDDSSLSGYGLWKIIQDGGSLLQVAGSVKEVWNQTPDSRLEVVQGSADKVTVDEKATGSTVLVDEDARVDDLNLDAGANVIGKGDIGKLNVGAAGSTVEQLPDKVEIRPGLEADINGETMNSSQATETSNDPKLLAGYPAVKNIAPASATLVFRTNKPGTVYWAISAVADGSVSEDDLLEPPVYGGKIIQSGTVTATAANTDYTAEVTGLTKDGSYYVTAMLVDGREQRSPLKVTSFTTPDDTVPAFAQGYPVMSKVTCDQAQVTVMTNKSCQLYYALLPAGSTAPTPAEFKAAAIQGNLGYGSQSVTKNVTTPINVNSVRLDEQTDYVLYLWLTDYDGAKSSAVVAVNFSTPDETPPTVTDIRQVGETPNSIRVSYTIDEPADLVWAIVTEGDHLAKRLLDWTEENTGVDEDHTTLKFKDDAALLAAKVRLMSGTGAIASGSSTSSPLNITNLPTTTSSYVLYYMANDKATDTGNLSTQIKALRVHTEDNIPPTVTATFTNADGSLVPSTENPRVNADIRLIFSESVKGGTTKGQNIFYTEYNKLVDLKNTLGGFASSDTSDEKKEAESAYNAARKAFGEMLDTYLTMYSGTPDGKHEAVDVRTWDPEDPDDPNARNWVIDWRNAEVSMLDDGTGRVEILLRGSTTTDRNGIEHPAALNLGSGESYYFHLTNIWDLAIIGNALDPTPCDVKFTTAFAQVILTPGDELTIGSVASGTLDDSGTNKDSRIDYHFIADPEGVDEVKDERTRWDLLIWTDTSMKFTLYRRPKTDANNGAWTRLGQMEILADQSEGFTYRSVGKWISGTANPTPSYDALKDMDTQYGVHEYAIHIDALEGDTSFNAWNRTVSIRASIVAGTQSVLSNQVINGSTQTDYDKALGLGVSSVGTPDPFTMTKLFTDSRPPEINGRPTVEIHDVGAEISMTLNSPGQVYYLVIPLSNLQKTENGATTDLSADVELSETDLQKVGTNYIAAMDVFQTGNIVPVLGDVPRMTGGGAEGNEGIKVSETVDNRYPVTTPVRDSFINGQTFANVFKGTTASVPAYTRATIDLNGKLESNKVYLVCLLTRGVSAVYADSIYCYRFTTSMPDRPILKLQGTSATSVDAIVDRTSDVRSVLLVETGLDQGNFSVLLNDATTNNGKALFAQYVKDGLSSSFAALNKGSDYLVRDALFEDYDAGGGCSVFDYFANDDIKRTVRQLIETTSAPTVVKAYTQTQTVSVTGNATEGKLPLRFSDQNLQPDTEYMCLAYARGGSDAATGFRATYPLQVMDDAPPILTSASLGLYYDANNTIQGSILLNFDKNLYNNQRAPLAQSKTTGNIAGTSYAGLGGIVRSTFAEIAADGSNTPTGPTIELSVTDCPSAAISVTVNNACNRWGTPCQVYVVNIRCDNPSAPVAERTFSYTINGVPGT